MISGTLKWDEGLSIGVGTLDHAHMELVDLCKRIDWACSNGEAVAHTRERIRTFLMYARWHFAEEEAWMRKIHYPQFVDHQNDHTRLVQDAEDFVQSFGEALRRQDGPAIAAYFRYWLQRHMLERDKPLRDYLRCPPS